MISSIQNKLALFRSALARRHTLRAHFWQTASNYTQQAGGLVLGVVLARLLQPSDFGEFAYASALLTLLFLLAGWSLTPSVVADGGKDEALYQRTWSLAWLTTGLKFFLLGGMTLWMWEKGETSAFHLVWIVGIPMVFNEVVAVLRSDLEAAGIYRPNFYSALWVVLTMGCLGVPLACLGAGVYALVIPAWAGVAGQLLIYGKQARRPVWWHWKLERPVDVLREGFWIWLVGLGETGLLRLDKFLLGRCGSAAELGNYNRAFNYTPISHQILNSLMTNATISALARKTTIKEKRNLLFKTAALVLIGAAISWIFWYVGSPWLVPKIFGKQWTEAVPVFRAMAGLSFAYAMVYLPLTVLLQARRYVFIALVRLITLALFGAMLLGEGTELNAVATAHFLLTCLILQGIIFLVAIVPGMRERR